MSTTSPEQRRFDFEEEPENGSKKNKGKTRRLKTGSGQEVEITETESGVVIRGLEKGECQYCGNVGRCRYCKRGKAELAANQDGA